MQVGEILGKLPANVEQIDIELLLIKVLNVSRANLRANPERELTPAEEQVFSDLLERRVQGEPVAYLVGHKEFWDLDLLVTPDVLIPRADTELLVELALEYLVDINEPKILELGTGSGAIALSLAKERNDAQIIATDKSTDALQIAKFNAKKLNLHNVAFAHGSWYEALHSKYKNFFDIIVSNPPYIAEYDQHLSQGDLRFEPKQALVAGVDGMLDLEIIINQAPKYLKQNAALFVEHGFEQPKLAAEQFAKTGFQNIENFKDLSGLPRVTSGSYHVV